MEGNDAAAAAKIAVWWDMKDCPVPEGYDARRVRPSIERAFKTRGYSGPVSITAYGDQTQTPGHILRGLSSTGIDVAHTKSISTCSHMFSDMLEWRARNPPPAAMMLISNQVKDVFSWDLARLQQETKYNLFLAFSLGSCHGDILKTEKKWSWKKLLGSTAEKSEHEGVICRETSAMFYCKSCKFDSKSLEKFRNHLSSKRHIVEEIMYPSHPKELDPVTRTWGRNYAAKPEYATAQIAVWWDMRDCPVPEGYDPRRVRPSLEAAFKHLGYSGPVSITAYGDLTQTPELIMQGLSSTGVSVAHTNYGKSLSRLYEDFCLWRIDNPPPATMMLISDHVEDRLSMNLVSQQQRKKYNLFLAYSYRPYKMSVLVTSAEWLWESLLVGHHPETIEHVHQKCSGKSQSTGMFYCKSCFCDYKSLDTFKKHLSSKEHASVDARITLNIQFSESERRKSIEEDYLPRRKRLRKARKSQIHQQE